MKKLLDAIKDKPKVVFALLVILVLIIIVLLIVLGVLSEAKAISSATLKAWWAAKLAGTTPATSSFNNGKVWGDRAAFTDDALSAGSNFLAGAY